MSNAIPINTLVAKRALMVLRNSLPMVANVNRDYQADISSRDARVGGIINVRKPPRYVGRDGELMKVESTVSPSISTSLQQAGVDMSFSLTDLQLTMDGVRNGGADWFLDAAMATVTSKIEAAGTNLYKTVGNVVGSATVMPTTTTPVSQAGAIITSSGGQLSGNRVALLDPYVDAALADSLKLVFNPTAEISKAYMNGRMGKGYGFEFFDEAFIQTHVAGTYGGSPVINNALVTGSTIATTAWSAASFLNVGDTFTIAGVFSVNPTTRQSTGKLYNFVVGALSTADGGGAMTITLGTPAVASGQFQNVSIIANASAPIVVTSGTTGAVSKQSLLYDPNAFTFACVPMATVPKAGVISSDTVSDPMSGLSLTMTQFYDGPTNQVMTRFDVLYAWLATYPELAVRLQSPAA